MRSNPQTGNKGNNDKKTHYILFSCNAWKEYSSMRMLGVTDNPESLYVMIGSCIRAGDMLYMHDGAEESWRQFQEDYHNGKVNLDILEYGYMEVYEEHGISSRAFASDFPKAASTWIALGGKAG